MSFRESQAVNASAVSAPANISPQTPLEACETTPSMYESRMASSGLAGASMPQIIPLICAPIQSE